MKKHTMPALLIAVVLTWMLSGFALAESAPSKDQTGVAAVVNGQSITEAQVDEALMQGMMASTRGMRLSPEQEAQFKSQYRGRVLENLVRNELLLQEAKKQKITAPQKELVAALDEQIALQLLASGTTRQEYEEKELKPKGSSWGQFIGEIAGKTEVKHAYMLEKLVKTLFPEKVTVSDEDIRKFYDDNLETRFTRPEQVRASHILFDTREAKTPEEKEAIKQKAQEVLVKARMPQADFAALAQEHSSCPSKNNGGDLNYFTKERMVPEFSKAAFSMDVGQISGLVESDFGYHIIKVTDKTPAEVQPFKSAALSIKKGLETQLVQQELGAYAQLLKEKATITYPGQKSDEKEGAK